MMIALLLTLQSATPGPGALRLVEDWTFACDNGRACQAIAMVPDGRWEGSMTMSLRRDGAADAAPVVTFPRETARGASLTADGRPLAVRLIATGENLVVHPADMTALIETFGSARALGVVDVDGASLGTVSLAGAAAAMLAMDEAQDRLDTPSALVRRGTRATRIAPPLLPEVRLAPAAEDLPLEIDAARIAALRMQVGCTIGEVGGPDEHQAIQIETGKTLVLLACGTGAYNLSAVPFIAQRRGNAIAIHVARFDINTAWGENQTPMLVNVEWDSGRRLLRDFSRGRGLGDCGTRSAYGWDGRGFRLVHREEMGECRGSAQFVTTWRARLSRP